MIQLNRQVIWEAVKEPLRLLVLAIIPLTVVYVNGLPYEWAGVAILVLRLIDKLMHLVGKELSTGKVVSPLVKGLTRF